ncbi:MAG: hypothetical protein IT374_06960 [Polyangiaceae bacterium]|nr:hypothetical protein [Polyangiaceae bacterium]
MTLARRPLLLSLLGATLGCGRRAEAPVTRELAPEDLLPSSLDVVVRVDVGKLRRALPDMGELSRQAAAREDDEARAKLVDAVATRGRELWIGARDRAFGDLVVAATGDFDELDLGPSFTQIEQSATERVFERRDAARDAPAWVLLRPRALVAATPAMTDAVARARARGLPSAHDVPRDTALGISVRARALVGDAAAQRAPFSSMRLADGSLDIEGGLLRGTLRATFTTEEHAEHAARVAGALVERARAGASGALLDGVEITRKSSARVVMTVKIPAAALRRALGR